VSTQKGTAAARHHAWEGNSEDEDDDEEEDPWRRKSNKDEGPNDGKGKPKRRKDMSDSDEEEEEEDEDVEDIEGWGTDMEEIWMAGVDGWSTTQPQDLGFEWDEEERSGRRGMAGGGSGWGEGGNLHSAKGGGTANAVSSQNVRMVTEMEVAEMQKSFLWGVMQGVVEMPRMMDLRRTWKEMYPREGDFRRTWLWGDGSPAWYGEEEKKMTLWTTIASMMDPTVDTSYLRERMNPWESHLEEVQDQLLSQAVETISRAEVLKVIMFVQGSE
jgi:hypothetical protein